MTATLDAHHHLWKYDPEAYPWMAGDGLEPLRRDFLAADLKRELDAAGIDGAVAVQASQAVAETDWLLGIAAENAFIKGVVGWVPLCDTHAAAEALERLTANPLLRGIRHIVQDEPDDAFLLRADFNAGIRLLKGCDLVYDILIFERHLPNAIRFADAHPGQRFVLDHIAKPRIRDGAVEPWAKNLRELAKREHVSCKLSGMVTEADPKAWSEAQLQPYFDAALDAFGPGRLMFGSDWPVCVLACDYGRWAKIVRRQIAKLSASEQAQIMGGTAAAVYGIALD